MTKGPRLLSELRFGAFFIYSPRGTSEVSVRSRKVRDVIKYDTPGMIGKAVDRLQEELSRSELREFFGPTVTLIPVPRSAPLKDERALWPARRLCEELLDRGLGREVLPCLKRARPVPKSAFAHRGERPAVEVHLESMVVEPTLMIPAFVTKGATLLAAGTLLEKSFPKASLLGFTLVRTMGLVPDVERIINPAFVEFSQQIVVIAVQRPCPAYGATPRRDSTWPRASPRAPSDASTRDRSSDRAPRASRAAPSRRAAASRPSRQVASWP